MIATHQLNWLNNPDTSHEPISISLPAIKRCGIWKLPTSMPEASLDPWVAFKKAATRRTPPKIAEVIS